MVVEVLVVDIGWEEEVCDILVVLVVLVVVLLLLGLLILVGLGLSA